MLNNFCFYVYAQKCQVVRLPGCQVVRLSSCHVVTVSRCQVVKFDPWDMLNDFCFHVDAQKSLFIGENCNGFFGTSMGFFDKTVSSTLSCEFRIHRAGSQLKILDVSQKLGTRNTLTLPLSHSTTLPLYHFTTLPLTLPVGHQMYHSTG